MTPKFLRFLLLAAVLNTVLFAVSNIVGISIWWLLGTEIMLFIAYVMVKAWIDPAQKLVNQGAHMGWTAAGTVRDAEGWRDTVLRRNDVVVRVSYKEKALYIVEPRLEGPYRDFVELERILAIYG